MVSTLLKSKWLIDLQDPKESFQGKTILIVGASTGLGLEAAKKLTKLHCSRLILGVRNEGLGEKVKEEIEGLDDFNRNEQQIEVWKVDLMEYDSIYAFAKRINNEITCLDGVILNAGVMKANLNKSKYGWEESLQVNTLSTVLLATLLLPKLLSSKTSTNIPVLEIVTSGLYVKQHFRSKEQREKAGGLLESYNAQDEKFNAFTQYNSSKLLTLYAITHLTTKFDSQQIQIIFVSPGMVATELGREFQIPLSTFIKPIFSTIFQRSVEQGSRSYISGLLLQGQESYGKIWQHDQLRLFMPNESKDEDGNEISTLVWQAIIANLEKDDKNVDLPSAVNVIP